MKRDHSIITKAFLNKVFSAINLVEASVSGIDRYDILKQYTPKQLEPFDALSDRFSRSIEICLKFFRSYEMILFAENSATVRDLLNRMAKQELISSVKLWMEMREVRNRIVHNYLPEEIQEIFDLIIRFYSVELKKLKLKLERIDLDEIFGS